MNSWASRDTSQRSFLQSCLMWRGVGDRVRVVGVNFNFVARREESVEANNEFWMTFEEVRDTTDHPRSVNAT